MTLGEKLQKLRKQKCLSQEALAEQVHVTRQTISKWELNLSTPELGILVRLSELYGVSMDYLTKEENGAPVEKAKTFSFSWNEKGRKICLTALSALAITAALVCLVCDYFTSGRLRWSLIVVLSVAASFMVLLPLFLEKERVLRGILLAVSLVPVPYLAGLALLLNRPTVCWLGSCLALAAIGDMWCMYGVCRHFRSRPWRAAGAALLVLLPLPIAVTALVWLFLPQAGKDLYSDLFNAAIIAFLALLCFRADARKEQAI